MKGFMARIALVSSQRPNMTHPTRPRKPTLIRRVKFYYFNVDMR